jgi:hypothetical protein
MKIRTNFVSNSSSTSFVVKIGNRYKDVFDLAIHMITHQEYGDQDSISIIKQSKRDQNTNISFRSINYDTFIAREGDFLLVSTCNNECFLDVIEDMKVTIPGFIVEKLRLGYYPFEGLHNAVPHSYEFWFPEYDLVGKRREEWDWCDDHHVDYLDIGGKKICPYCYKEGKVFIEPLIPFNRFDILDLGE